MTDSLFDLRGKIVLAAGAARGLGYALAQGLAARDATIVVADRLADEGAAAAAALPGSDHGYLALDITDEASVSATVDALIGRYGRLDVVLNSAGIASFAPAAELTKAAFEATLAVNVTGAFVLSRHAAKAMQRNPGGAIIHLASVSSRVANPGYSAYAASKAALSQLIRILALEWAAQAITVNAIGPAMTPTPLTERELLADPEQRARALAQIPMGRLGSPQDLLGAVVLLASEAGRFITGQTLFVDGGRTLV